jgi:phosphate starvation-inducible protein PhoH and related proteins
MRRKNKGRRRNHVYDDHRNGSNDHNHNSNGNGRYAVFTPKFEFRKIFVEAQSDGQDEYLDSIEDNKLTICTGPAGTGKTLIAVASAINMLYDDANMDHIVIVRPAITACDEKLGFLPGNIDAKMGPFMLPILYNLSRVVGKEYYSLLMKNDIIKVIPLAYMRGLTLDNCVAILDEAQNTTPEQMKMFLTRIGEDCKVIVEGDEGQTDIKSANGLADSIQRLEGMEGVGLIRLCQEDIVRSSFVARIVERYK